MTGPTNTGSSHVGSFTLQTVVSWQFYVTLCQNAAASYNVIRQERFANVFEESKWGSYDDVVLGSKLPMFPLSVCDCVIYTDWLGQCG